LGKNVTLINAFKAANDVLRGAVQGIAELITRPGLINVDFADVRTVMSEMGMAMMGTGVSSGDNRARMAAEAAIASPLLEDVDLSDAKGILVNITAGLDLSIGEFEEVGEVVKNITSESATVVVGTVIDTELRDEVRVTVIVTGLGRKQMANGFKRPAVEKVKAADQQQPDYNELDKPAIGRKQYIPSAPSTPQGQQQAQTQTQTPPMQRLLSERMHDVDYLDIPAFLRRKEEEPI
jgi:cell division protein FtsZ